MIGCFIANRSKIVLALCGCIVIILLGCTAAQIEHRCGASVPRPAQSVEIDGVSVNFEASLESNRFPTVVLIHGFGASLETWHDIYPALSAEFSTVRFDLMACRSILRPAWNRIDSRRSF